MKPDVVVTCRKGTLAVFLDEQGDDHIVQRRSPTGGTQTLCYGTDEWREAVAMAQLFGGACENTC